MKLTKSQEVYGLGAQLNFFYANDAFPPSLHCTKNEVFH